MFFNGPTVLKITGSVARGGAEKRISSYRWPGK